MKCLVNNRALRDVLLIGVVLATTAASCDGPVEPGYVQRCATDLDPDFPTNGSFTISKPASCPFKTPGMQWVDYAATGRFPSGSVFYSYYELTMSNRVGGMVSSSYNTLWNMGADWAVYVNGEYLAASGNFDQYFGGFDLATNRVRNAYTGAYVASRTRLEYTQGYPDVNLAVPAEGYGPGVPFTSSASTDDLAFVNPVTWKWYVDGVLRSTAGPEFEWYGGEPEVAQEIRVTAVDGAGRTHTSVDYVQTCSDMVFSC